MTIPIANARVPKVQIRTSWADPWTDLPRGSYELGDLTEGCSGGFGSGSLMVYETAPVNREEGAPAAPVLAMDTFVRVGAEDLDLAQGESDRVRWLWVGAGADLPAVPGEPMARFALAQVPGPG